MEPYLFISSLVLDDEDLLESNLRFLTTGKPGLDLLLNTGSDATTIDSVKLDVVNFFPKLSLFGWFDGIGDVITSLDPDTFDESYSFDDAESLL